MLLYYLLIGVTLVQAVLSAGEAQSPFETEQSSHRSLETFIQGLRHRYGVKGVGLAIVQPKDASNRTDLTTTSRGFGISNAKGDTVDDQVGPSCAYPANTVVSLRHCVQFQTVRCALRRIADRKPDDPAKWRGLELDHQGQGNLSTTQTHGQLCNQPCASTRPAM